MNRRIAGGLLLVAAIITSATALCVPGRPFTRASDRTYRSSQTTAAGNLMWDIVDCETGQKIGEGNKTLFLRDIAIIKRQDADGYVFYNKRIDLEQGFYLELFVTPKKSQSDVDGFGFVAGRARERTFSWEWFNIDGKSHATKLQEQGSLEISVKEINGCWEVVTTTFLSDISFRIDLENYGRSRNSELRWRVNIRQGSAIFWPSLVGEKVLSNG